MNDFLLDLLILVVLAIGAMRGVSTGAIKQVASLLAVIIGFILGVQLMQAVGALVAASLGVSERIAPLIGFLIVFSAAQLLVFALSKLVEKLVGALKLGALNRLAGAAVGAFKAALLLGVLFLALGYVGLPSPEMRHESVLYGTVSSVLPRAWDYTARYLPYVKSASEAFGAEVEGVLPQAQETSDVDEAEGVSE